MNTQLDIPFGLSPGCELYTDEFMISHGFTGPEKPEEVCQGGLVFPLGQKDNCEKCASTCAGCIEMAVNLGYAEFEDVKHLIYKPEMLSKKFREKFKTYIDERGNSGADQD